MTAVVTVKGAPLAAVSVLHRWTVVTLVNPRAFSLECFAPGQNTPKCWVDVVVWAENHAGSTSSIRWERSIPGINLPWRIAYGWCCNSSIFHNSVHSANRFLNSIIAGAEIASFIKIYLYQYFNYYIVLSNYPICFSEEEWYTVLMSHLFEQSAWGIVYRRHGGIIEVLLLKWKNSGGKVVYTLPKWHTKENEAPADAALREIAEETGLEASMLRIKKFIKTISFSFTARHKTGHPTIDKDVHLYLVEYLGTRKPQVQKEERFVGFVWLTPEQLKKVKMKPAVHEIVEENRGFM